MHQQRPPADRQQITHSHDFERGYPYTGWTKTFYPVVAFDSYSAEFRLAERLENSPNMKAWQRIHGTVPLAITYRFNQGNKTYVPDFIVIEDDGPPQGRYWIVEGKANKDFMDPVVIAKRDAAKQWVAVVNASSDVPTKWGYILASESVIVNAPTGTDSRQPRKCTTERCFRDGPLGAWDSLAGVEGQSGGASTRR